MAKQAVGYVGPGHEKAEPWRFARNAAYFCDCTEADLIEVPMWACSVCGYLYRARETAEECESEGEAGCRSG